ncbi:hypothetical protein XBI1_2300002 [Xenorhabdus bovienii str. Intermedium]|uniref:Uncharacterized protein n=1 Tax=Xenorhabdus bovienii str. Intermedium TaxID=1379677 RepID=A0A077QKT5_XENBV|nr:hypothetical protein XBI1_2300002 [Xenorhabdus bovienii str. Intermedium]
MSFFAGMTPISKDCQASSNAMVQLVETTLPLTLTQLSFGLSPRVPAIPDADKHNQDKATILLKIRFGFSLIITESPAFLQKQKKMPLKMANCIVQHAILPVEAMFKGQL